MRLFNYKVQKEKVFWVRAEVCFHAWKANLKGIVQFFFCLVCLKSKVRCILDVINVPALHTKCEVCYLKNEYNVRR